MAVLLNKCRCCGSNTIEEYGEFEICSVCGWEDDEVQYDDPDFEGGANDMSLNQAKKAYLNGKSVK